MLKGLCIGLITCLVPLYVSEIFPASKRGAAISVFHITTTLGTTSMYVIGHILERQDIDLLPFKVSWLIEGIFAIISLGLSFSLPESPKWLASKSKWIEAAKTLERVRTLKRKPGENNDRTYVTKAYTAGYRIQYVSFANLFRRSFKQTSVGMLLHLFVELTSITSLMYFFTFLCESCGVSGDTKILVISVQYILLGLLTFIPLIVLDKARRVDFLTYGILIMGFSYFGMFMVGKLYAIEAVIPGSPLSWSYERESASAMLALFLFLVSVYASSIASVSWLYIGEIFPDEARAKGMAVCMCLAWIANSITTLVLPIAFEVLNHWVFLVLSVFCIIGALVFSTFPETKTNVEAPITGIEEQSQQSTQSYHSESELEQLDVIQSSSSGQQLTSDKLMQEASANIARMQLNSGNSVVISEESENEFNKKVYNSMKQSEKSSDEFSDKLSDKFSDKVSDKFSRSPRSPGSRNPGLQSIPSPRSSSVSPRKRKFDASNTFPEPAHIHNTFTRPAIRSVLHPPHQPHHHPPQTPHFSPKSMAPSPASNNENSTIDDILDAYTPKPDFTKTVSTGLLASGSEESYFSDDWQVEDHQKSRDFKIQHLAANIDPETADDSSILRFPPPKNPLISNTQVLPASFLTFDNLHHKSKAFYQEENRPKRSKTNLLQGT